MHIETHADNVHNNVLLSCVWTSQVALVVKNPPASRGDAGDADSIPWVRKIPWRRAWQPTPGLLPGESSWTEEPGGLQSMGSQESYMI